MRVTLEGKRFGMVGTIRRRGRLVKLLVPPPVPENYYWLVFEMGQVEEGYSEDNLDPVD